MKNYLISFEQIDTTNLDEKLEFVLALAAFEQDVSVCFLKQMPENKKIASFALFGIKILDSNQLINKKFNIELKF